MKKCCCSCSRVARFEATLLLLLVAIVFMVMVGRSEGGRDIRQQPRPSSVPSTMVGDVPPYRGDDSSSVEGKGYVELRRNHGGDSRGEQQVVVYGGKEVKNCMPKGFRHTSAPSRYVNYLPLLGSNCH